jgi:hypothetical protein
MRVLLLAGAVALLAAGCGSSSPSAESVVRAWSQALNTEDNAKAADLFAPGAEIVQAGRVIRLRTHAQAVRWNSTLPCSGQIVSITTTGHTATATFKLGDRANSRCDAPGERATAIFRVTKGKIVLWHQTGENGPPQSSA